MRTGTSGKTSRIRVTLATLLGASALATSHTPVLAQVSVETAARDDSVIIVTAQRRAEALEDVPMSVEVVNAEAMAAAGVNSLRDIQNVTTGVTLNQGGAYPQPTIRGVSTVVNGTYENNIAVYIDGLYQPAAQTINIDLPNVESIQVLKGPQGTLYGRNATGGAILLNTIMPGDVWEGRAELTYARFDDKRASAYVAGPLTEAISFSAAGYTRRSDGYVKKMSRTDASETDGNAAPLKQDAVRLKVVGDLTDNFRAIAAYNYVRVSDPRGNMFSPLENVSTSLMPVYDRMPRQLGYAAYDIGTDVETKQHEGSLTLELDTAFGQIRSITGYSKMDALTTFDFDGSYLDGNWSGSIITEKTLQQALDFTVDTIEGMDLVFGGTYFHDKLYFSDEMPNLFYAGTSADPGFVEKPLSEYLLLFSGEFNQRKEAFAVYGDLTVELTDTLSVNVGGRYSIEDQDVSGRQDSDFCGFGVCRAPTSTRATFEQFTPRASVRYELAPRSNVYATYSKGFRSGAFNSQIPAVTSDWRPAEEETIDAYEVGFKTAGSNYRLEVAGFYYDYKNLQVSSTIVTPAGNAYVDITNAPEATIKGAEASFEWQPIRNFTVRGGITYLDAEYGDGFLLSTVGVNPLAPPALNASNDPLRSLQNFNQIQDLSGQQMARAPEFAGNLGLDYLAETNFGSLRFAANAKYTDSYVVSNPAIWCDSSSASVYTPPPMGGVAQAPIGSATVCGAVPADRRDKQRFRQGSYVLLNASITYTDPSDQFYSRFWINNILNEKYRLHYTGNAQWGSYAPMAEPLTYGISAGYKF